jgi:hypothetical protein
MKYGDEEWQEFIMWLGQFGVYMLERYNVDLIESFMSNEATTQEQRTEIGAFLYAAFKRSEDPAEFSDEVVAIVDRNTLRFSKN